MERAGRSHKAAYALAAVAQQPLLLLRRLLPHTHSLPWLLTHLCLACRLVDRCFWLGDFNYRIDLPRDHVDRQASHASVTALMFYETRNLKQ